MKDDRVNEGHKKRRRESAAPVVVTQPPSSLPRGNAIWICLGLAVLNLAIYARTFSYGFVTWDDPQYITENPQLRQGLTLANLWWALTTGYQFYWHPLTWLSYMLDFEWFGFNAGGYHGVNVILHIASTTGLFLVLREMTRSPWRSALVAALFAVHPLRVESVAWVAERKDTLSTLFWILTMWAYVRYARQPSPGRYIAVALLFTAGLMSKPMVVTLPFALMLLDVWPLERPRTAKLIWEKLPLFALSVAGSIAAYVAQRGVGAVADLDALPISSRIANAIVSYAAYLWMTVWPTNLAALYPFLNVPAWEVAVALVVLAAISVFVYRTAREYPYLAVGWLWYVGTLVPVIGLVQVGGMSRADRFTYIPHIGLLIALVWGASELAIRWRVTKTTAGIAAGALTLILTAVSVRQTAYWSDSITMWDRTLAVTTTNYRAHLNLGVDLRAQHRVREAIDHFRAALAIHPAFAEGHNDLGGALAEQGEVTEAIDHYREALHLKPDYAEAHNNLGVAYANQGHTSDAINEFLESLRANPNQADVHSNLGVMYETEGKIPEALEHFRAALRLNPQHAEALRSLDRLNGIEKDAGRR